MAKGVQITTRVSPYTIKRLARELDAKVQRVDKFSGELGKRLAETAAQYAADSFDDAFYDGVNDVSVAVRKTKKGNYSVTASGTAVAFIEYGTGVHFTKDNPYPGEVPSRFNGIGEYGEGHGKKDYWRFKYRPGVQANTPGSKIYRNQRMRRITYKQLSSMGRETTYTDYDYDAYGNPILEASGETWVFTHGNKPNACMYNAFQNLVEFDFNDIVDEVRDAKL